MEAAPGMESLTVLQYSTFMSFVLDSERYPDLAWREQYATSIADGTLRPPKIPEKEDATEGLYDEPMSDYEKERGF